MVWAGEEHRNGGSQRSLSGGLKSLTGCAADPESGNSDMDEIKSEKSSTNGETGTTTTGRGSLKSSSKKGEYEAEKIRVGRDYQAVCPEMVGEKDRNPDQLTEKALLVWSPTKDIPDSKLEDYIRVAKEKYGYNGEQALGMLFWHKHDLERAVMDLANFTPFPDEWTVEDKVLFEQAFQFHGKSFNRIRQMLPDKSIASLVKYYYSWKKSRARPTPAERSAKNKGSVEASENGGSEPASNEVSDEEEKITIEDDATATPPAIVPAAAQNAKTESVKTEGPTPDPAPPQSVTSPPMLDEITIIPITTSRSSSKSESANNSDSDGPTAAKIPKLDTVCIIKRPQTANP